MKTNDLLEWKSVDVEDVVIYHGLPARVKAVLPDNKVLITYYEPGGISPTQERVVSRTTLLLMRSASC
jgi:hypothetical protein